MNIVGEVEGKTAILIDDIIDTAGTITLAADAMLDSGAKEVLRMLYASGIIRSGKWPNWSVTNQGIDCDEYNSIDWQITSNKIKQLSVGELIAESIKRVHEHRSISTLFN